MKMQFVYHNEGLQTKETSPKFSFREKGRLFSIKNDGTDSYPFIIKKDEVLFGSGLTCDIRIHVVGVAEEHCSIVIVPNGKAYLNPLAISESTCLNDLNVSGKVILLHNDIITIGNRRFRFQYPSGSSLTRYLSYEDDSVESDSKRKVNSAKSFLLLNSKRQSLPSRASDVKKIASFGTKRKSLDFSDSSARKSLRRRVTFGPRLSPEEFDKRLPPASPLRRGSLPNRKRSILNSAKHKITAAPEDKRFKHCKAMKLKFSPKCSTSLVATPVNDKNSSEDSEEKVPSVAKRLLFSEVLKKPIPVDDLFQKPAPSGNKPKVLNVPADKCVKKLERCSNQKNLQESLILKKFGISSTGHANSPATILISKTKKAASKDSSDCRNSADFNGSEISSCSESSVKYNHPSKVAISMLANSEGFYNDQTSGTPNEGTKQASKPPAKCTSTKSTPHSSPSFTGVINSNKTAERSMSSLNEGHARQSDEENEKQFDTREAIKSLIFNSSLVSEISNNFGEASSSSSNCIDVVKQVVFALSMANAYHDYKNIIEDIVRSPQRSSLTFEVSNKNSSSPDEIIADNQEESSLKNLIKKNRIFLQLIHKYQPKLLSKEIQELLKDCETSDEFSPGPPVKVKRTSCTNLSARQSFKKQEERKRSRFRKKSSTGKEVNMECSSRADCDGNLNLDEPKLKSPMNVSFLGNETVESTSKGENSKRQKISTSPSTDQNVKLHLRSKHLKSDEKSTVSKRTRHKESLGNEYLSQKLRIRRTVRRRSSKVQKLKKRVKPDHSEEGSAKKSCLDKNDSMPLKGERKTMSPIESRTSGTDLSLEQSNCIIESTSETNTSGVQEMKARDKIRSKRKNEPEATEQSNALSLQRKSLKRKYSLRAIILKGRKSYSSTDKRRRRKSSVAKQLIATAKTAIRQSKLLTIKDTPSSEVAGEDLKISKGRRRRVRAAVTPKASSTKSRKRANSLVKKDATSDRAVKKIALDDDPEKSLKNSDGTPAKSKLNTPAKSKGQPTVKSVELTDTRTPIKRRNLRKRNIEVESSSSTKKQSVGEAPDIKLMSPNSKTVKKSPSKLVAGRRTRAKPKRESLKPKDVPVELKSPVKKRSTKKNEGIKEVSSSTKAVEGTPSKSRTGKRKRASATTSSKRRNLKSKDAPIVLNSPVENSNDDSTKKAKVAKLPSKTKGVRKRPSTGKDSMPQKRVSPKRVSPEKRITRSIRRKISGEKKN